jgi:hypothetical protein
MQKWQKTENPKDENRCTQLTHWTFSILLKLRAKKVRQFYELLEDLAVVVECRNEPTISHPQLLEIMSDRT